MDEAGEGLAMKVVLEPRGRSSTSFTVTMEFDNSKANMGSLDQDPDTQDWIVTGPLLSFLKLFTGNPDWRKGNLGKNFQTAQLIVLEVVGAWSLIASHSDPDKPIKIHKLDVPIDSESKHFVDLYREFRPLTEDRLVVGH